MSGKLLSRAGPAVVALLLWVNPAHAGGWAVTTLDELPAQMHAGETYRIGYSILQHGITPFQTSDSLIQARSGAGQALTFAGKREGVNGHYVAEVRFPTPGEWTWEVLPGPFEPLRLAPVSVQPAGSFASVPLGTASGVGTALPSVGGVRRIALPVAAALAGVLFILQLADIVRQRRDPSAPLASRAAAPAPVGTAAVVPTGR